MQREVENIVENSYMNLSVWELGLKDCAGSCEALNSDDDSVIVNWMLSALRIAWSV